MTLINNIRFIVNHPLNRNNKLKAIHRFLKWQIIARINPYPIIYPFTDWSKLIIKKGMTGATGNLYCGLHEFEDMGFTLHFLRKKDLFIDIGANIGSYTILSSSHVGSKTIAIEPVPSTFSNLVTNISINQIEDRVKALNIALGSKKGLITFTSSLDSVNHVAIDSDKDIINVNIETLDDILIGQEIPVLLKIDVEGYETEVVKGARRIINDDGLKAIIIELTGSGNRYGYNEDKIHEDLISAGFKACLYDPFTREIKMIEIHGRINTIYVRDIDFVQKRLISADRIKIFQSAF
jgi:FkbM family methyltransferase